MDFRVRFSLAARFWVVVDLTPLAQRARIILRSPAKWLRDGRLTDLWSSERRKESNLAEARPRWKPCNPRSPIGPAADFSGVVTGDPSGDGPA